jgi:hypothetical protein
LLKNLPLILINFGIILIGANAQKIAQQIVQPVTGEHIAAVAATPVVLGTVTAFTIEPATAPVAPVAPVAAGILDPSTQRHVNFKDYLVGLQKKNASALVEPPKEVTKPVAVTTPICLPVGPNLKTVPKYIQTLSADQYAAWAVWQNAQTKLYQPDGGSRYNYGGVEIHQHRSGSASSSQSSGSVTRSGKGHSSKRSSSSGLASSRGQDTIRAYPMQYLNNDYSGPGPQTIYNPFYNASMSDGVPAWDSLYVPFEGNIVTLATVLHTAGPVDPEILYSKLLAPYFSSN